MDSESQTLEEKKEELIKIKEELKKAKEKATQSWLDSRPLIDDLERLKSILAISKDKNAKSETLTSELEAELKAIESSIKSKKEGELNSTKATEELTRTLDQLREETETLKRNNSSEVRQKRPRLKQGLRVKRQKLRALQLMLEAAKKETEAYSEGANEAIKNSSFSEAESVKLSHEEYEALKKRSDEEKALADWLISVAAEEKAAAKKSRDLALAKWEELKKRRVMRMKRGLAREENVEGEELGHEINQLELVEIVNEINPNKVIIQTNDQPSHNKENYYYYQEAGLVRRTVLRPNKNHKSKDKNKNKKKKKKKKKKRMSFFMQIRQCFVINIIKRLFG